MFVTSEHGPITLFFAVISIVLMNIIERSLIKLRFNDKG